MTDPPCPACGDTTFSGVCVNVRCAHFNSVLFPDFHPGLPPTVQPLDDTPAIVPERRHACDCGALAAKTTHAPWCSTKGGK